jgi:hypothetical protein
MAKHPKSIIFDDAEEVCYLCGKYGHMEVHHIFGGSVRQISDKYGLIVHLCPACHGKLHGKNGSNTKEMLHIIGQQAYEEQIGTREKFIEEFIRSYL